MSAREPSGYALVTLAMMLLVIGISLLALLPPVLGKLKTQALLQEKKDVLGLRDTVLGFAMDNCRLPTTDELQVVAPQYGLDSRTGYILAPSPVLTAASALGSVDSDAATELTLLVPAMDGVERYGNLAFMVYGTGLNRRKDLDTDGTECQARVSGERYEKDGKIRVYDDIVRGVTLQALCSKTGCCR